MADDDYQNEPKGSHEKQKLYSNRRKVLKGKSVVIGGGMGTNRTKSPTKDDIARAKALKKQIKNVQKARNDNGGTSGTNAVNMNEVASSDHHTFMGLNDSRDMLAINSKHDRSKICKFQSNH